MNKEQCEAVQLASLKPVSIEQPNAAFTKALREKTGIHRYCAIMRFKGDVSKKDNGFQKLFNGYYNIRRSEQWRKNYYELFQEMRTASKPNDLNFGPILCELYERTGKVEPSFTSKMLATIDPSKPIWDSRVVSALKCYDPNQSIMKTDSVNGDIDKAIHGYSELCDACQEILTQPIGKSCIKQFDAWFSEYFDSEDYSNISNMKKLDVVLWCAG